MIAQALLATVCLGGVLLLIVLGGRVAKTMPGLRLAAPADAAIVLRGTLALDRGRRLHLVQAGGCQTLVLTGGGSDVMVTLAGQG